MVFLKYPRCTGLYSAIHADQEESKGVAAAGSRGAKVIGRAEPATRAQRAGAGPRQGARAGPHSQPADGENGIPRGADSSAVCAVHAALS